MIGSMVGGELLRGDIDAHCERLAKFADEYRYRLAILSTRGREVSEKCKVAAENFDKAFELFEKGQRYFELGLQNAQ